MIASCNAGIQFQFQAWRAARSRPVFGNKGHVRYRRKQGAGGRRSLILSPPYYDALHRQWSTPGTGTACLFACTFRCARPYWPGLGVLASETRSACRGVLSCQIFKDPGGPAERATPAGPYMPSLSNTKVHLLKGCTQFKCHSLHNQLLHAFQPDFIPLFLRTILISDWLCLGTENTILLLAFFQRKDNKNLFLFPISRYNISLSFFVS